MSKLSLGQPDTDESLMDVSPLLMAFGALDCT